MIPGRRLFFLLLILGVVVAAATVAAARGSDLPVPADVRAADALATQAPSKERDKALAQWAKTASLTDIVWVLRRPPAQLGAAEATLSIAALEKTPESRIALRRRLVARALLADPKAKLPRSALSLAAQAPPHVRASVFRTAAILPDTGDYQGYGQAVRAGLAAGLADSTAHFPVELIVLPSGDGDATRILNGFDSVSDRVGSFVGELLSTPTLVLATATRYAGLPLLSPTAPDESVGRVHANVFQIGPSGMARGRALARATLTEPRRVGVLVSSTAEGGAFARAFSAAADSLRSPVVWSATYAPGGVNFKDNVRELAQKRVELLFWDGDPREADALIRQLARDRVSVRICGGEPLAPTQHHSDNQLLFEGVQYVDEEWTLADSIQARLDGRVVAVGETRHAGTLECRGYLTGRLLAAAVRAGALCPEEIAERLAGGRAAERGFLDVGSEGASLRVYTVSRGKAEPLH